MVLRIINLTPASSSEQQRALEEVKDFALTDMDHGGQERWTYRMLNEPALSDELEKMAEPQTSRSGFVDSVSLQPCRTWHYRSQDRYRVEEWALPGGSWTYAAVFDGHMNHETVDYVSRLFGPHLRGLLEAALRSSPVRPTSLPALVSGLLRDSLHHIDDTLISDFLALFPKDPHRLARLDPAHVRTVLNETTGGDRSGYIKAARAFGGSTALVTLVDSTRRHLWVANVGDCVAVLGESDRLSGNWRGRVLNSIHNGSNPGELERIRSEHPEESDCAWNDRVLGFLAPTRAIGDAWLKLPAIYAQLVFKYLDADWLSAETMEQHVPRIRTPPYLSNTPDVYHVPLDASGSVTRRTLILCSDGLTDLYDGYSPQEMADEWTGVVGRELDSTSPSSGGPGGSRRKNLALSLLREAIGGDDTQLVSRNLTVEMEERWMDDTTIVLQQLLEIKTP